MSFDYSYLRMEDKDKKHTLVLNEHEFRWLYYFLEFKGLGFNEAHDIRGKMEQSWS